MRWGKVSLAAAATDYGVILAGPAEDPALDQDATVAARNRLRAARPAATPFFDRGPGYARLSGGQVAADVDWL